MWKMYRLNNRGSSVVEASFIIPIVFFIIVMIIQIFISCKAEGEQQSDANVSVFLENSELIYGEAADRLWRWQLYGDILQE